MTITTRPTTVEELQQAPELAALLAEYASECAIDGMPSPQPDMPTYATMNAAGLLHAFGSWSDDELIGFLLILVVNLPHYSALTAVSESYFVASSHRATGAGLALLRAAEAGAREMGAVGILMSAPVGGRLDTVLSSVGYRPTNRVHFKGLQ